MSLTTWAAPAPRLPSLVEAARASRELSWREWDESRKAHGQKTNKQKKGPRAPRVDHAAIRAQALELQAKGFALSRIAREVRVSRDTLIRVLGDERVKRQVSPHGSRYRFESGCRCELCCGANRRHCRKYRLRKQLERGAAEVNQAAADARAVRGGGRVTSRMSR